jgi:hypothetical protein
MSHLTAWKRKSIICRTKGQKEICLSHWHLVARQLWEGGARALRTGDEICGCVPVGRDRKIALLLVIGGASSDILHFAGQTAASAGGAGMYTAMAAHRSGIQVSLFAPCPSPIPGDLTPGEHSLYVGMYAPSTGERLPASDANGTRIANNAIPVGAFSISSSTTE